MRNVAVVIQIAIPQTPEEWDLYRKPGREDAARDLTLALEAAVHAVAGGQLTAQAAYDKYVQPVATQHAKLGADDTEPRSLAFSVLIRASVHALDAQKLLDVRAS